MGRGGKRVGAGRPAGAATIKTRELANVLTGSDETPLEVMLRFMALAAKAGDADRAVKFATLAAPYMHPRLSSIEHVPQEPQVTEPKLDFTRLTTVELEAWLALQEKATITLLDRVV